MDIYIGQAEEARWMKLVVNLQVGALAAMLGEALTLGRAGGLDWKMMLEVMEQSVITSPLLKVKLPYLINRDFSPAFTAKQMTKDYDLIFGRHGGSRRGRAHCRLGQAAMDFHEFHRTRRSGLFWLCRDLRDAGRVGRKA